jgi:Zn-dependent metalloprotease
MRNYYIPLIVLFLAAGSMSAQSAKIKPPAQGPAPDPALLQVSWPGKNAIPPAAPLFQSDAPVAQPLPPMTHRTAGPEGVYIERDQNGRPIFYKGRTTASQWDASRQAADAAALAYLASLQPEGILDPLAEFETATIEIDEQGNHHVRLQQVFKGVPVYGAELIAHSRDGYFDRLNGRFVPSPNLSSTQPALDAQAALQVVYNAIGRDKVKTEWNAFELSIVGGQAFKSELLIYPSLEPASEARLAWLIEAHPNLMQRFIYVIDAHTGAILDHYDHTCRIDGGRHTHLEETGGEKRRLEERRLEEQEGEVFVDELDRSTPQSCNQKSEILDGPVTASGLDLLNINRSFGAWQVGSQFLLEDASKPMFNSGASQMPNSPVGAIITLDALNTSPQNQNSFNYDFVKSGSTTFNNKKGVSAHWNSSKSYDYFKNTFNRNAIDGVGGNIISFINVAEDNGASMENAFWNGNAMWYGNGGSVFKELARGLDVGGHEMSHGVIEKTANLIYQNESGALNESFADIFGAMIDRDDWKIGEDVVQNGVSPGGCLRDMQNPNNNDTQGGNWWQPKHMNQKYTGPLDNGGVHINSGIPNHAYYLFATNAAVGKDKAEQIFYKALRDYLVKSSQFIDLRIAVLQASNDLYGATVANAAAAAFDQVGIGGSAPGGNYLGQLNSNPGTDLILCATNDLNNLEIATGNGTVLGALYTQGLQSRPSISDNGSQLVFVNEAGHIIGMDLTYNGGQINFQSVQLSSNPEWRNAAISKDGRFLAAITETAENKIYVFDLLSPSFDSEVFTLYNPTYTQGQITGDVQYADVLEFDYSGKYLMYDAFNQLDNNQGQDISYWDIGFLEYWKNGAYTDGNNAFITKLFSGLPENTSIGNPTFSKNSPFIIAFDVIDDLQGRYDVYGANTETGEYDIIISDNGVLGWPNYNRLDNTLIFESEGSVGLNIYRRGLNSTKIQPQGNISQFIADRNWGVWYANGNRSLTVDAEEPLALKSGLRLAPNPTSGWMQVQFEMETAGPVRFSVLNLLGQTVLSSHTQASSGTNIADLQLDALPEGQYILRLDAQTFSASQIIIKQ